MDFRVMVFGLLFWLPSAFGNPMKQMDDLVPLSFEFPQKAIDKLKALELKLNESTPIKERLRLQLLKCHTLAQLGENKAAINLARLYEAKAQRAGLKEVRPYFHLCMADAYANMGNLEVALPLLDTVVYKAKEYYQPQLLTHALWIRSIVEEDLGSYMSPLEDINLALDIYHDIFNQTTNWLWPPHAYLYISMANLLVLTGDTDRSIKYINHALAIENKQGKIKLFTHLAASRMYFDHGDKETSYRYLQLGKEGLLELDSLQDVASSYVIVGSLERDFENYEQAVEHLLISINLFTKSHRTTYLLRAKRLYAQILFEQKQHTKALGIMNEIIPKAIELKLYGDLEYFYLVLKKHYLSQGNYKKAFEYLNKAHESAKHSNNETNNARLVQYKARLDRQASLHNPPITTKVDKTYELLSSSQTFIIIFFVISIVGILIGLVFYFQKKQFKTLEQEGNVASIEIRALNMLQNAKRQNQSVTAIVAALDSCSEIEKAQVLEALRDVLREDDLLLQHATDEWVILLPKVNNTTGYKIIRQITHNLPTALTKLTFGLSTFKSFDNLDSLIKRAYLERLSQIKRREVKDDKVHNMAM